MHKIFDLLNEYKQILKKCDIDTREARLLLAFAMDIKADEIIKYSEVSEEVYNKFENAINKRILGVPYAYITGSKEFMKLLFKVNENVLIPRPETEQLVEEVLKLDCNKVLDMCTGSGCIAISIAYYNKKADVTAVDISHEAIKIAKENAENNDVKICFIQSDLFSNVQEKFDLIVSNPPYIKTKVIEELQAEVKKEPFIALDGGESGLDFYKKISKEAYKHLNENGILMFEIGYDQGKAVKKILEKNNYKNIIIKKDLAGKDRLAICEI